MLQPKQTKYRKQMKGRNRGLARRRKQNYRDELIHDYVLSFVFDTLFVLVVAFFFS
jgi:ribosomal protein L16/L10AE